MTFSVVNRDLHLGYQKVTWKNLDIITKMIYTTISAKPADHMPGKSQFFGGKQVDVQEILETRKKQNKTKNAFHGVLLVNKGIGFPISWAMK